MRPAEETRKEERGAVRAKEPDAPDAKPSASTAESGEGYARAQRRADFARSRSSVRVTARSGGKVIIKGDVAGRDKDGAAGAERELRWVYTEWPPADLQEIRERYVAPDVYPHAASVLEAQHLVVLHGAAGIGKAASAKHLLAATPRPVFELDAYIENPVDLTRFEWQRDSAYLIDTLRPQCATRFTSVIARKLHEQLAASGSALVVTIDESVRLNDGLREWLVEWTPPADRRLVLTRLMRWRLRGSAAQQAVDDVDCAEELLRVLESRRSPGEVVRAANALADAVLDHGDVCEAVRRLAARPTVEEWFREPRTLDDYTFLVALAVLNGASYQAVVEAAAGLRKALGSKAPEKADEVAAAVMGTTFSQRHERLAKEIGARIVETRERVAGVAAPTRAIEVADADWAREMLHHVWHEHDLARAPLLKWLREQGRHASQEVWIRAADVASLLSGYELGLLLEQVIMPWVRDEDGSTRDAAAYALGLAAGDGGVSSEVQELLHEMMEADTPALQWTAAAAYGYVALNQYGALWELEEAMRSDDLVLVAVASLSLMMLFEDGDRVPDQRRNVLSALVRWSTKRDDASSKLRPSNSLSAFLELAAYSEKRTDRGDVWPTVLWLLRCDETAAPAVVELWRRGLSTRDTRDRAFEVLHGWLERADELEAVYEALRELLIRLGETELGRDRLRWQLEKRSEGAPETSAAARLLAAI